MDLLLRMLVVGFYPGLWLICACLSWREIRRNTQAGRWIRSNRANFDDFHGPNRITSQLVQYDCDMAFRDIPDGQF
jgi:hypothetical protein